MSSPWERLLEYAWGRSEWPSCALIECSSWRALGSGFPSCRWTRKRCEPGAHRCQTNDKRCDSDDLERTPADQPEVAQLQEDTGFDEGGGPKFSGQESSAARARCNAIGS